MSVFGPADGFPFKPNEVFVAEITAHHSPTDEPDPDPMMGVYNFPRHYDWVDPLGRYVQPPLLPIGNVTEDDSQIPSVFICENIMSVRGGRARNVAERLYDEIVRQKPVPVGTPVLMGVGFYPLLVDPEPLNCSQFVQQAFVNQLPYFFFNIHADPWSAYCFCTPDNDPDNCPPHPEP